MKDFLGRSGLTVGAIYVAFVGWSVYGAIFPVETHTFRLIHLGLIFALGFIVNPISEKARAWSVWIDLGLAFLGIACVVYALSDLDQFLRRSTLPDPTDIFFGIAAII